MVAWSAEQREALAGIEDAASENGYDGDPAGRRSRSSTRASRTSGPGAEGALEIPGEGIVCPFTTTLAFATEAVAARVRAGR